MKRLLDIADELETRLMITAVLCAVMIRAVLSPARFDPCGLVRADLKVAVHCARL